ncbi:MAG: hypothetical protein ACK55I_38340, partial [bacterium]
AEAIRGAGLRPSRSRRRSCPAASELPHAPDAAILSAILVVLTVVSVPSGSVEAVESVGSNARDRATL